MRKTEEILLVDDDPVMIQVMGRILSDVAQIRFATGGHAALQQLRREQADLVLLDAEMPGMSGYQVCEAMKQDPALADTPVIFVSGHAEAEFELKGLEVGAADFITKPFSDSLLLARVRTQLRAKRLADDLRRVAAVDALTELVNRPSFDAALQREWKRGLRSGDPISLLMVDIDHLKFFNDRYGHSAGDACLRSVAQTLRKVVRRPADLVARYAGGQFALLLPQTPRSGAEHLAHRVLDAVEAAAIAHDASPTTRHVTVSIGIGCLDQESACWDDASVGIHCAAEAQRCEVELIRSADKAMHAAKAAGRAQAWRLDIADVDKPNCAREISPWTRPSMANPRGEPAAICFMPMLA